MRSVVIGATVLAFVAKNAEAFFMPGGALARTTSLAASSAFTTTQSLPGHGASCACSSCAPGVHGSSCACPSCTSGVVSGRSHGSGCRCGACSVRMQAHGEGCGCGECSPVGGRPALHGASCKCSICMCSAHSETCNCAICAGGRRRTSATVLGMASRDAALPEVATSLRQRLSAEPDSVMFDDTMGAITVAFDYTPKRFVNGVMSSDADINAGSCKVFSFGKIVDLSPAEVLACFGEHYRSVVADPAGDSHGNIRAFMETGWEGIEFPDGLALASKE